MRLWRDHECDLERIQESNPSATLVRHACGNFAIRYRRENDLCASMQGIRAKRTQKRFTTEAVRQREAGTSHCLGGELFSALRDKSLHGRLTPRDVSHMILIGVMSLEIASNVATEKIKKVPQKFPFSGNFAQGASASAVS
jgi:hypothetical protein